MSTGARDLNDLDFLRAGVTRRRGVTSSALYVLTGLAAVQAVLSDTGLEARMWVAIPATGVAVLALAALMLLRARHRGYALRTRSVWIAGAVLLALPLVAPSVLVLGVFTGVLAPAAVAVAVTTAAFTRSAQPQVVGAAAICVVVSVGVTLSWWANYLASSVVVTVAWTAVLLVWAVAQAKREVDHPHAAAT